MKKGERAIYGTFFLTSKKRESVIMENLKVPRWKVVKAKEEQIAEQLEWLKDPEYAKIFDEWIDSLREDLKKTPEQREKESEEYLEELLEREAEQVREEILSMRHDRDEWVMQSRMNGCWK